MFLEQLSAEVILFFMLYGGLALTSLIASIYLCVRKGNAFAAGVTPPLRLRRWAASLFCIAFLGHIWWLLFYLYSNDIHSVYYLLLSVLDCVLMFITIAGTLFAMLQDRERPFWPIIMATLPYAVFVLLNVLYPSDLFMYIAIAYFLLLYLLFTIYMVFAVRQYGRWLRDNYADLEHKEVWTSHVLVIVLFLLIITYGLDAGDLLFSYLVQLFFLVFICLLLWRVETLPQLENVLEEQEDCPRSPEMLQEPNLPARTQQSMTIPSNIQQLLAERCESTLLYLKHDLTLLQLAQTVGTNRFYLSQYFSRQGITYNAYINNLRINHFMSLYREAANAQKPISAQQLASDSGYRSYSTFSLAFKQRMGRSVSTLMRETAK